MTMQPDLVERYAALADKYGAEVGRLRAEVERLQHDWAVACKDLGEARAEVERLRDLLAEKPKPDLRALLPELAVIRQVMKDTKP